MPNPTVSVILPCYNAHRYLTRALDSVRAQTFRDFEIIVIDDGSTDPGTVAYLNQLPSDIRLVRQENRGLPGARNTGFHEARGKYVLPLDCDDWLEPTFIEKTLVALEAAPERAFAFAQMVLEGDAVGQLVKHYNFFEQLFLNQLPYCLLVRKSAWAAVGGYDESMREGYEDWELNIRMGGHGWFGAAVPEPLFHYHVSRSGMLLSMSSGLHGRLWTTIQRRNP
ncbi:MAG: glycosyltransferase family A protein, partial [Alphaproteobacteria bacterium]